MTSNSRVLIIGIDGLDADLLLRFRDSLPNFAKLIQKCPSMKMSSVFPPDSPTAWASIFTGLNPAKHGIVSFKDPLSHTKIGEYLDHVHNIAGRTFWDFAGKYDKKCCILFPHLAYPPWPVNGILVSRTTEVDIKRFDIKTYPPDLSLGTDPVELKPITSFPTDVGQIIQPTKQLILNEVDFGVRLFKELDWDVFFIFFSSLDNIEHVFWMDFDEKDPEHNRLNPYRDVIPLFYEFYDEQVIGRFLHAADPDTIVIVLSDHGHGLRSYDVVNVNEFLARAGFLETRIKSHSFYDVQYLRESVKRKLTSFVSEKRIAAKLVSKFLSLFPQGLKFYTSSSPVDWSQTRAYLSDCSAGLKAYSYAGVRVNRGTRSPSYDEICHSVIELLLQIEEPSSSEKIVEWAIRREELYRGPFVSKYPDIVFKLKNDWGVGWETDGPLYGRSLSHKIFSGTHKQDSAVFLLGNLDESHFEVNNLTLTDVTPTILDLLGVDDPKVHGLFDGRSIVHRATK